MNAIYLRIAALCFFGFSFLGLMVGCSTGRDHQRAYNSLNAEVQRLEDQYFELDHRYRIQQRELVRCKQALGEPIDEQAFYSGNDDSQVTGFLQRGASRSESHHALNESDHSLTDARGTGLSNSPHSTFTSDSGEAQLRNPDIRLPSESMSADEFMTLLTGDGAGSGNDARSADANQASDEAPPFVTFNEPNELPGVPAVEVSAPVRNLGSDDLSDPMNLLHRTESSSADDFSGHTASGDRVSIDPVPTHIVINPALTGGRDLDGASGDDGFSVTIVPRNADGIAVRRTGELAISVIDPAESGEDQRIGIWQFTKEEVDRRVRSQTPNRPELSFTIPWLTDRIPSHRQLKVFVRFTDESGATLEATSNLTISIPGDGQTGWSMRTTPLGRPPHASPSRSAGTPDQNERQAIRPDTNRVPGPSASHRPQWQPYR